MEELNLEFVLSNLNAFQEESNLQLLLIKFQLEALHHHCNACKAQSCPFKIQDRYQQYTF